MDSEYFDHLAKSLAQSPSRRRLLTTGLAALAGALLSPLGPVKAAACKTANSVSRAPEPAGRPQLQRPYGDTGVVTTCCYGCAAHNDAQFYGLDFANGQGFTVLAAASGRAYQVNEAGLDVKGKKTGLVSTSIYIDHGSGWYTKYGHLASRSIGDAQWVNAGTAIGVAGTSGLKNAKPKDTHLHFELIQSTSPSTGTGTLSYPVPELVGGSLIAPCATGQTWCSNACVSSTCVAPTVFDAATCACACPPADCANGANQDSETCECECPTGYEVCNDTCTDPWCEEDQVFDEELCGCVIAETTGSLLIRAVDASSGTPVGEVLYRLYRANDGFRVAELYDGATDPWGTGTGALDGSADGRVLFSDLYPDNYLLQVTMIVGSSHVDDRPFHPVTVKAGETTELDLAFPFPGGNFVITVVRDDGQPLTAGQFAEFTLIPQGETWSEIPGGITSGVRAKADGVLVLGIGEDWPNVPYSLGEGAYAISGSYQDDTNAFLHFAPQTVSVQLGETTNVNFIISGEAVLSAASAQEPTATAEPSEKEPTESPPTETPVIVAPTENPPTVVPDALHTPTAPVATEVPVTELPTEEPISPTESAPGG